MKNLHKILSSSNEEFNYWTDAEGTNIPVRDLAMPHINNIITRFGPKYLKSPGVSNRDKMFEAVVREWHRRFGYLP